MYNIPLMKLSDVCIYLRGLTYSKSDEVTFSKNIVLRANNINHKNNTLDFTELKYINDKVNIPENKKVKKGSMIICTASGSKSHLGKVALIDREYNYAFGGFMGQITPKKEIDSKYLFYNLTSDNYKNFIGKLSDGININNLKFDLLKEYKIPLPPLPEQRRIVKILDDIFEKVSKAKENVEKNLKNARELFESYLHSVFEKRGDRWEEKRIGEVCEIVNGGTPKTNVPNYWNGNIFWITPKDMGKHKSIFVDSTFRKITNEGLCNSSAKILPVNSIILSSRAPIGHLAINKKPMTTNQGCKGIIPSNRLNTLYLYYFLKNNVDLLNSLGSGTTFKELSSTKLKEIEIQFPNHKEQKAIVLKLDELSEQTKILEEIYKRKLSDFEELKKSVLKKAFTGEL